MPSARRPPLPALITLALLLCAGAWAQSSGMVYAVNFLQTPGGTLSAGTAATVTPGWAALPAGLITGDQIYLSGGTGQPESVSVTNTGIACPGGTALSLCFTPANSHSGAWTLQSASGGIQEAINTLTPAQHGAVGLVANTVYNVYSSDAVPPTVALTFVQGAVIKPASGVALTVEGAIVAGNFQIFDLSAGGSISGGAYSAAAADGANPFWFGATCRAYADDSLPIQEALDSFLYVKIPAGLYSASAAMTPPTLPKRGAMRSISGLRSADRMPTSPPAPFMQTESQGWEMAT